MTESCPLRGRLVQIIESVRRVEANLGAPYLEVDPEAACAECAAEVGPCPVDEAAVLVVEAIRAVDWRAEQAECVRRHHICAPPHEKVPVAEICRLCEEETGTSTGCD